MLSTWEESHYDDVVFGIKTLVWREICKVVLVSRLPINLDGHYLSWVLYTVEEGKLTIGFEFKCKCDL